MQTSVFVEIKEKIKRHFESNLSTRVMNCDQKTMKSVAKIAGLRM